MDPARLFRRGALAALALAAPACSPPEGDSGNLFALDLLHSVTLQVEERYLAQLDDNANEMRVPCDITFDGVRLARSGIRKKGGIGSVAKIAQKTGWSIKFDEFVAGQKIHGLDRILLNNAKQDVSFLNEHLGYEVARRAGMAAPRTAYAAVTFNGVSYGLYVIAEAIDGEFLRSHFGRDNDRGNLYEGPARVDFVTNPAGVELKNEIEEKRSRDDLKALVDAIRQPLEPQVEVWVDQVGRRLDWDSFLTDFAVNSAVNHWDSYEFNTNNYYMYHHPGRQKFLFIPHGMDQLWRNVAFDHLTTPKGVLAQRVREIPSLDQRFRAEVARVVAQAYDVPALLERIAEVERMLRDRPAPDERTAQDILRFDQNVAKKRTDVQQRKMNLR